MDPLVSLINFDENTLLTFFAVLMRMTTLLVVMPFFGDKVIPAPIKVLLGVAISFVIFPMLLAQKLIRVEDAAIWSKSAAPLILTIVTEVATALVLGFVAKLIFDGISAGANFVATLMGFSSASFYDPTQESNVEIIGHLQFSLAMILFLALNGHLFWLTALVHSYDFIGIGGAHFDGALKNVLIHSTSEVLSLAVQLSAPYAITLFITNIVYGLMGRSMPSLNILVLSFSVTTLIGFAVMFFGMPAYVERLAEIFESGTDALRLVIRALKA